VTYEPDAYSQTEEWDWEENPVNLNRVFSATVRKGCISIESQMLDLTDPEDCGRVLTRIRQINLPRSSTEVSRGERFTPGEWFLAKLAK
jgi:hypothetical protein